MRYEPIGTWAMRTPELLGLIAQINEITVYKKLLKVLDNNSMLSVENGITRVDTTGETFWTSHKFVPHIQRGLSVSDFKVILNYEIVNLESKRGVINIPSELLEKVQQICYRFNRLKKHRDKEECTLAEINTSNVLYFADKLELVEANLEGEVVFRSIEGELIGVSNTVLTLEEVKTIHEFNRILINAKMQESKLF